MILFGWALGWLCWFCLFVILKEIRDDTIGETGKENERRNTMMIFLLFCGSSFVVVSCSNGSGRPWVDGPTDNVCSCIMRYHPHAQSHYQQHCVFPTETRIIMQQTPSHKHITNSLVTKAQPHPISVSVSPLTFYQPLLLPLLPQTTSDDRCSRL